MLYFADTRFPIERANGVQTMATCHALAEHGRNVVLVVRPDTAPAARIRSSSTASRRCCG